MVWLRPEFVSVREFQSADGMNVVSIFRRPDGNYGYACETGAQDEHGTFWSPIDGSGIYDSAEVAEKAALTELPWLAGPPSN